MNQKRTIRIKNLQLRKIRNNLRLVLISATHPAWDKIHEEQEKLLIDREGNVRSLSYSEKIQFAKLQKEKQKIKELVDRSICKCPVCQRADQDMTFNPVNNIWFCVQCYQKNKEFYKYRDEYAHLFP